MTLTAERARDVLTYEPDTGHLRWKVSIGPRARIGAIAGTDHEGYLRVSIDGRLYLAHRVIWLILHGRMPTEIDHINRIPGDNRLENLREVDRRTNMQNQGLRKNSTSGVPGVSLKRGKWVARKRTVDGKRVWLGAFASIEQAAAALRSAS